MTPPGSQDHPIQGLALFGGAFDPPHLTHRRILDAVVAHGGIDALWVIPSGNHPFKGQDMAADGKARVAMCRMAFAGLPGLRIDERELTRATTCYTADILAEIRTELAAAGAVPPLHWVIGSDNFASLDRWHQPERVLEQARLIVYPRAGFPVDMDLARQRKATVLEVNADPINATAIREELPTQRPHPHLDPRVDAWIRAKGLYGCG